MFILGCHRSGTSYLTAAVKDALLSLDKSFKDLGAQFQGKLDNPHGFHETAKIVELNDYLLKLTNSQWDHPFLFEPRWGDFDSQIDFDKIRKALKQWSTQTNWIEKDPRLCLTRNAYLHLLLKQVPSIAIIRHPYQVANSLFARDRMPAKQALGIWIIYNYHIYNSRAPLPLTTITLENIIIERERASLQIAKSFLDDSVNFASEFKISDLTTSINKALEKNLDSSLCRSDVSELYSDQSLNGLDEACNQAYEECKREGANHKKIFEALMMENILCLKELFPSYKYSAKLLVVNEQLKQEIGKIKSTRSWKITSFSKRIVSFFRRLCRN